MEKKLFDSPDLTDVPHRLWPNNRNRNRNRDDAK